MKLKIGLAVVLTVGLGLYLFWHFSRDPSLSVRAALDRGEKLAAKGGLPAEACAAEIDNMRTFCIEGFYYQSALNDLADSERSVAGILEDEMQRFGIRTSPSRLVWAVAYGLALVKTERSLTESQEYLAELRPLLFAYVVDGWALEMAGKFGGPATAEQCQGLAKEWQAPCLWGIGRARFFYPKNNANLNEPLTKAGFEFARRFTQPGFLNEARILNLDNPGAKIAELAKHLYDGHAPEDSELRRAAACLTVRHVTECL